MITESASRQNISSDNPIVDLIETYKMSSIDMIASKLQMEEEDVRTQISLLLEEGIIFGTLSEDGSRFYLSDVKVSDAPVIRSNNESIAIEHPDISQGKYTMFAGVASIIAGFVMRGLGGVFAGIENIGSATILLGIAVLASGWLYISRKQSSLT